MLFKKCIDTGRVGWWRLIWGRSGVWFCLNTVPVHPVKTWFCAFILSNFNCCNCSNSISSPAVHLFKLTRTFLHTIDFEHTNRVSSKVTQNHTRYSLTTINFKTCFDAFVAEGVATIFAAGGVLYNIMAYCTNAVDWWLLKG